MNKSMNNPMNKTMNNPMNKPMNKIQEQKKGLTLFAEKSVLII